MTTPPSQIGEPASVERQQTLAQPAEVRGIGFVKGSDVTVRLTPAELGTGLVFVRTDLPGRPEVPVSIEHVQERQRRTAIRVGDAVVEMTEHVLAAFAGLGVDHCRIELDGPELPGVDGSCLPFVDAILTAGLKPFEASRQLVSLDRVVECCEGDARITYLPAQSDRLQITYTLDYGNQAPIPSQCFSWVGDASSFVEQIAPARTFVFEREVEALLAQGIGSRASAKDLLVFDEEGRPLQNELRFPEECARHKALDVVGDMTLLGRPLAGHIVAYKSGHRLNALLVRKLLERISQTSHQHASITAASGPTAPAVNLGR